jgi:hypothetical protein
MISVSDTVARNVLSTDNLFYLLHHANLGELKKMLDEQFHLPKPILNKLVNHGQVQLLVNVGRLPVP